MITNITLGSCKALWSDKVLRTTGPAAKLRSQKKIFKTYKINEWRFWWYRNENRNIEEEEDREDREKGETSFGGNNPEDERASLSDTGNREGQGSNYNRVKTGALSKLKKVTGNIESNY